MIEEYQENTVTEEVDGIAYTSTKFSAVKSLQLLSRTVQVLGEEGLQVLVALKAKALAEKMPAVVIKATPKMFRAAVQLAHGFGEDGALSKDLCANTKCNSLRPTNTGGPLSKGFDLHFAGELPHLFKVLGFILAHNYVGFTLGSDSVSGSPGTDETSTETSSDSQSPNEE